MDNLVAAVGLIILLFSGGVLANSNYNIDRPAESKGRIILFQGLNQLWFQLDNMEEYKIITEQVPLKNKKPRHKAFLLQIYGIEERDFSKSFKLSNDKQFNTLIKLNDLIKGKEGKVICFDRNSKNGIPICQVLINNIDIGFRLIAGGASPFKPGSIKHPELVDKYQLEMKKAQYEKVGIWEPYYGLFLQ